MSLACNSREERKMTKKVVNYSVSQTTIDMLKELSESEEKSMSMIVSEAVKEYYQKKKEGSK